MKASLYMIHPKLSSLCVSRWKYSAFYFDYLSVKYNDFSICTVIYWNIPQGMDNFHLDTVAIYLVTVT
jgi:hypothetical protein